MYGSTKFTINTPHTVKMMRPGKFHRKNAMRPPSGPARLNAVEMTNCVDVGPGRPCPIAKSSVNASSSIQSRCSTKWSRRIATCACGPPNATNPNGANTVTTSHIRSPHGASAETIFVFFFSFPSSSPPSSAAATAIASSTSTSSSLTGPSTTALPPVSISFPSSSLTKSTSTTVVAAPDPVLFPSSSGLGTMVTTSSCFLGLML
mmetsp:Transcript_54927/g.133395  ORF Transcript_54927/g.133395 Transcript_54927/m.133395 type:complete len:205 (-) Transcript_54927:66-680(-)